MKPRELATDAEIIQYVRMLMPSLYKKPISDYELSKVRHLYDTRQISLCISKIIELCGLKGIGAQIWHIKNNPSRAATIKFVQEKLSYFGHEATMNDSLPEGAENSAAFVIYYDDLPLYGTPNFSRVKILIFIYEKKIGEMFEIFVHCIVHELCHVLLDATRHPLRKSEVAVDLSAMIIGFCNVMLHGRYSGDAIYGYLNDAHFELAYEEIRRLSGVIYL